MREREREGASLLCLGGKALPGEVGAGLPASGRRWQLAGVVAVGERAWAACPHEEGPKGRAGGLEGLPRVHLAADAPWMKSTGVVQASGGEAER